MPSARSLLVAASVAVAASSALVDAQLPLAACQANYQCPPSQAACGGACYDVQTAQYTCFNNSLQLISDSWTASGTVPYVVGAVPISQLQLSWNLSTPTCSNGDVLTIQPGIEVQQDQVDTLPTNVQWPANNGSLYTFVVFDPDAPTRSNATESPYVHFAAVNIPVPGGNQFNLTAGNTVYPFAMPAPPQGSGYHRYIWLVFLQVNGTRSVPNVDVNNRTHFDWYGFAAGGYTYVNGTKMLNHYPQLVSGNFFYTQYQDQATSNTWSEAGIVPEILPANPPEALYLSYNSSYNGSSYSIYPGSAVNTSAVATLPNFSWAATNGSYYSLILIDPDVPSRTTSNGQTALNYAVANVRGNNVRNGTALYPYYPPSPPAGEGYHRFIYLVYQQLNGYTNLTAMNMTYDTSIAGRIDFNYTGLIANITGDNSKLVAGNFFVAQNANQTQASA